MLMLLLLLLLVPDGFPRDYPANRNFNLHLALCDLVYMGR